MRKILTGFLGILVVVSIVGGSAYALFTSTATVSGVTFATGNANLQVGSNGSTWASALNLSNNYFKNLYPLQKTYYAFNLKNNSSSDIALNLTAKLRDGVGQKNTGDWDKLKSKISVAFDYWDGSIYQPAGFATLAQWNSPGNYSLLSGSLPKGANRWYRFHVNVADGTSTEMANAGIYNVVFEFTGTQE